MIISISTRKLGFEAYAAVHIPEAKGSGGRQMGRAEAALADFGKNFSEEDYLPEEG